MKALRFSFVFVVGFLPVLLQAVSAQFQPKNLIKHYGIKDGLSQGVINSITQDNSSLMWFATEDGLNRFDGYTFKIFRYDPDNKYSIADNFIQNVFKDSDGVLWVSSRKGLLKFDPLKESFSLYQHQFSDKTNYAFNDVSYITEGGSKNLWISWYGSGFASFNKEKKTFTPYTPNTLPGLSSERTVALLEDKFGLLWVGTQNGGVNVFKVSNGLVIEKLHDLSGMDNLPSMNARCFTEDEFGNVWIGTATGLLVYKRQENKFFLFSTSNFAIAGKSIMSLFADTNDNLWIGTQGSGLFQLDIRQFNTRSLDDFIFIKVNNLNDFDISIRTIQSIYEDKDKNIWVGTFGNGVYLVSSTKEKFVKVQKPLYENAAVSFIPYYGICHDNEGNLWLGTDGNGIYKSDLNGHTIRHFMADGRTGSLKDNAILSAFRDHKNQLWFGSYSQGVFLYNKASNSFINYRYTTADKNKVGGNDVRVIFEDSKKNIWVGTNRGGLCLLDRRKLSYTNPSFFSGPLLNGDVRSITEDGKGTLWIGFYGDGIYSYTPFSKKWKHHFGESDNKGQLKNDMVFSTKNDRAGNIWIGTGGGGLCVFHPETETFNRYTEKDGLSNNTIYSILVDKNENVWVSTNAGVSKFDVIKNRFYNYDVLDGLQEGQFNPGSAMYNDVGGYMCFGGTLGYNIFYPDQVSERLKKPEIMITGLLLFNKPVEINDSTEGRPLLKQVISNTKELVLKHDQNVITFEFVGLNYSYPEKNKYAYKLEGLDPNWNFVANQRTATYRYLEPGEYIFKVKASNHENEWNDDFASIAIKIKAPFWKTPLAYLLYILAVSGISYFFFILRKKQLNLRKRLKIEKKQRKHERQLVQQKLSFFTEVSHEFRTPLTLMIGPLEEMLATEGNQTPTGRKLKMVSRNAHKLLNLINKLLDYRKIESGNILLKIKEEDIVAFVEEIYVTFKELADRKSIKFNFHSDQPSLMLWFDKEKLEMVLNNIISNSFKYIGTGDEINIFVSKQISDKYPQGRATIKVKDNGIGIPKRHLGNIFDWFYKGDNSGTMSTGIGLSLAKKLIHLHKGEIFVDSVQGSGSTFSIKIPLGNDHFKPDEIMVENNLDKFLPGVPAIEDTEIKTDSLAGEDVASRKGLKSILLVEDDEEIRVFLKEYFQKTYKVYESTNGMEGLAATSNLHPDLIISDIMMPEMNGIDLCRALKSNIRTSHIPVILLTAKTMLTHHKEGIEMGADAYITKPFSPEVLALTIQNLFRSRENVIRFYRSLFTTELHGGSEKEIDSPDKKFLHSIYEMLKSNLDKPDFNIHELCEVLNMSRSLVYKKVKMLTGLSPVEYVRSLRMQEAAKLLKSKKYKVFEVVYMVGFSDLKYFRQCFVKEFGYSPSEYIKQTVTTE